MLEFLVLKKYPVERKFALRKTYSKSVVDDFLRFLSKMVSQKPSKAQPMPKHKYGEP